MRKYNTATAPKGQYKTGVTVERLGPREVRFTCPRGHARIVDYAKCPVPQQLSADGLNIMVPYWKQRVTYVCPTCRDAE